ncbi:MAG: 2,3-bisphosphoglycerate-dependent phosphoglycerate mutase [Patescibacteria group bacterium]|nr:2,3-bisphosphoglycerate-dependent phosphoglycerate mutase [Patescibacteria group bacterium]
MNYLVIVRHGLTEWTKKFTGWTDIDLVPEGVEMTKKYAVRLKEKNIKFDLGYASVLKRSYKTLEIVLEVINQKNLTVIRDWHLNERHYGDLQGKEKPEMVKIYGEKQVNLWRRSYDVAPPNGESLKNTYNRVVPYFQKEIEPKLKEGKNIIFSGHSNSIRALVKYLDNLTNEEIVSVNIPYCIPLVYEFENGKKTKKYYLASNEEVEEIIASIKNQLKK